MAADNHTTIAGNLVEDPEVRFTNNGIAVTNLRVAVTQRVQQDGQWRDGDTSFFKVNVWRGQAENLIKLHKTQLASDRTSCRSPLANQVRLVLHTAAYWLLLTLRDAIPKPQPLASAEFKTVRLRLIKVAARIIETATRVRIAFTASCPEAELFARIARWLQPAGP